MSENSYQILLEKLDQFIRKYYKNRMIRGFMYGSSLLFVFFLAVTIPEYFGEFGIGGRTFLFWVFMAAAAYISVRFFMIPLFKLLRLGQLISHDQAALIIGKHFPDVEDKLLNTLQLKEVADHGGGTLIDAAISQRLEELRPIPFASAVDFGENRRYIKYVAPPLAVILVILFAAPSVFTESTERLVRHAEEIERIAPYSIDIINKDLSVPENDDFLLAVNLDGDVVPNKLYLVLTGQQFKMKEENGQFAHTFRKVQKDTPFQFYGDGFYSREYTLETLPTPLLLNFSLSLDYPAYTKLKDEQIHNTGDITVPAGTKARWIFETRNTSKFKVRFSEKEVELSSLGKHVYQMNQSIFENDSYQLKIENDLLKGRNAIEYQIRVVPDVHPLIAVNEERDSVTNKHFFFTGDLKDDYGFRQLTFNYFIVNEEESQGELISENLAVNKDQSHQQFFHYWDLNALDVAPGEQLSYYFEIWDNDGVNGSKSSRTLMRAYNAPTTDELEEARDQQNENIKDEMEDAIQDAKEIQKDLEELRKDLLEKNELSWQDKKKLEELLEKQREMEKNVKSIQKQNEQKNQQESEFTQKNEEIVKKQEQLELLMEQVMSDELRELMEELEKLMEELNLEEIQEQIEEMDMSTEDLEKELDRALEQFKQLEWEMKMEEALEDLEKLAEEQKELSEESKKEDSDSDELKEKQDELNKKFEEWEKEMEDIESLNEELEEPNTMPEQEEKSEAVKEDQKESSDQLEKDKKKKASESQKSAGEKMEEMAQQMEMMMTQQAEEKAEEDLEALRALLENIITLSFDQEELMELLRRTDKKDPRYVSHGQVQRKLKTDAKMVADSLFALSKRITQLQAPVNKEISLVNENMLNAIDHLGERQTDQVNMHQQYVMTSFNNLALLLDEALQQMQKESSCDKPGTGNCEKPGGMGKKPSSSKMKKMQQALTKKLEQMKKDCEGHNKGKNNSQKSSEMSEELAKMAAKQAAIRREIEKMGQKLNEDGSGAGNELKKIAKEMEDLERDIVNKEINQQSLERQQDILIRLLKAENAERQREMDEQRQSKEARDQLISNPMKYSEYQKKKEQEVELLKTVPPALKPYYKEKVNEYFNKLDD